MVCENDAIEDLTIQREKINPIGTIAIIRKSLTTKQIFHYTNCQIDTSKTLGVITIDLKLSHRAIDPTFPA